MLPISAYQKYFLTIPKDFDLFVNGERFRCSKQVIKVYSELLKSKLMENPEINKFEATLNVSVTAVQAVLDLIHVKSFRPNDKILFDCYIAAAYFGIECARVRLIPQIYRTLDQSNFTDKLKSIVKYHQYCIPFINYLEENPSFGNDFIDQTLFSQFSSDEFASFIYAIAQHSTKIFKSESEKLDFISKCLSKVEDKDDFSFIFSNLDTSVLSYESIVKLFAGSKSIQENCRLFPLIKQMLKERDEKLAVKDHLSKLLDDIKKSINEGELIVEESENMSNELSNNYDVNAKQLKQFKMMSSYFADKLEFYAAVVFMLSVIDPDILDFINNVSQIYQRSIDMYKIQNSFKNSTTGKVIYPNGTNEIFDIANKFKDKAFQFSELMKMFHPDSDSIQNISNQLMDFATALRQL